MPNLASTCVDAGVTWRSYARSTVRLGMVSSAEKLPRDALVSHQLNYLTPLRALKDRVAGRVISSNSRFSALLLRGPNDEPARSYSAQSAPQ